MKDPTQSGLISERWELKEIRYPPSAPSSCDRHHWNLVLSIYQGKIVTLRSSDSDYEIADFNHEELSPVEQLHFTEHVSALKNYTPAAILWRSKLYQCLTTRGVPSPQQQEFIENIMNMARSRLSMGQSNVEVGLKLITTEVVLDDLLYNHIINNDRPHAISKPVVSTREDPQPDVCSICLDYMTSRNGKLIELPACKHAYHHSCIVLWLEQNNTCPICRDRCNAIAIPD